MQQGSAVSPSCPFPAEGREVRAAQCTALWPWGWPPPMDLDPSRNATPAAALPQAEQLYAAFRIQIAPLPSPATPHHLSQELRVCLKITLALLPGLPHASCFLRGSGQMGSSKPAEPVTALLTCRTGGILSWWHETGPGNRSPSRPEGACLQRAQRLGWEGRGGKGREECPGEGQGSPPRPSLSP